ncbi:MAG: AAA family ATPase [Eubacteriales bacterium]|nr:AAA family ATPase [Eubacteriales bacterium]
MDKLKIAVVTNNIDQQIEIKNLLKDDDIVIVGFLNYDNMTSLKLLGNNPDVIIFVRDGKEDSLFVVAADIYAKSVGVGMLVMADDINLELLTRAMECGIRQVVGTGSDAAKLKEAIFKSHNIESQRVGDRETHSLQRKVISYFGGKGGTGKTTVSVNTAVALANAGKKTVILDLDLQFGDVPILLDIEPKDTIYTIVEEKTAITIDSVKSVLAFHRSGLGVLAAPRSPEFAEYVDEKTVETIINVLKPYYEYIIIDLPPGFNDTTIAAIENSDIVNLVSAVDISSLRNAKLCMNILEALRQSDKATLILNRMVDGIVSKKDFEQILDLNVALVLPDDTKTVLTGLNKGVPFVGGNVKNPIVSVMNEYVRSLITE